MLLAEAAARGVVLEPLEVERGLDQISMSAVERSRLSMEGLKLLGKLSLTVARAARKHEFPELPDMSLPVWLEPPAAAVYVFPSREDCGCRWVTVNLDPESDQWLARVYAAAPRLINNLQTVNLDAWITCSASPSDGVMEVHIGERCVGLLDQDATATYQQVMHAATQRAELPCVEARLTLIPADATYLLEVALPAAPADPVGGGCAHTG